PRGRPGNPELSHGKPVSSEELADHPSVNIRQSKIATRVAVCQAFVVEAEKVEERGVEVVNMDLVLDGGEAEFISSAVDVTSLDATAGHPHAEPIMIVVPTAECG